MNRPRRPSAGPAADPSRQRTDHAAWVDPADQPREGERPRGADPAIMDVRAGLAEVKAALLAFGATPPQERSIAFEIDEHVLLLAYDEVERLTTIAVGGQSAAVTAHRLADQLERAGHQVTGVLPGLEPR